MAYADQIAAIKTHAVAAGAALTRPILDVEIGPPYPGTGRCVRISYGGETEPVRMGGPRVLDAELIAERIVLTLWIPVTNLSLQEIAAVETELYAFKHELRTRVLGDSQLGGKSTDLEMAYCEVDYGVIGNARYRVLETEFLTDYQEYTIAP